MGDNIVGGTVTRERSRTNRLQSSKVSGNNLQRLVSTTRSCEALWDRYVELKLKADRSYQAGDVIAAQKAWSAWLSVFLPNRVERRAIPAPKIGGRQ